MAGAVGSFLSIIRRTVSSQLTLTNYSLTNSGHRRLLAPCSACKFSTQRDDTSFLWKSSNNRQLETPSPYKPSKPTRYGYTQKLFDGGLLPRIDDEIKTLPQYKPKDAWCEKRAFFGQNDYIDILGDGSVKPHETIVGPAWLRGFRGHEYARTIRRLKCTGRRLEATYPKLFANLRKRVRYLYKQQNMKRKSHRYRPKHW